MLPLPGTLLGLPTAVERRLALRFRRLQRAEQKGHEPIHERGVDQQRRARLSEGHEELADQLGVPPLSQQRPVDKQLDPSPHHGAVRQQRRSGGHRQLGRQLQGAGRDGALGSRESCGPANLSKHRGAVLERPGERHIDGFRQPRNGEDDDGAACVRAAPLAVAEALHGAAAEDHELLEELEEAQALRLGHLRGRTCAAQPRQLVELDTCSVDGLVRSRDDLLRLLLLGVGACRSLGPSEAA
mmetsp:Transcript_104344/g.300092  ORF Transcript_104344/g.300092 Transcript_104344/m.300092 type:complete len:242 (+) Transcript_104344:717-1442(+)